MAQKKRIKDNATSKSIKISSIAINVFNPLCPVFINLTVFFLGLQLNWLAHDQASSLISDPHREGAEHGMAYPPTPRRLVFFGLNWQQCSGIFTETLRAIHAHQHRLPALTHFEIRAT